MWLVGIVTESSSIIKSCTQDYAYSTADSKHMAASMKTAKGYFKVTAVYEIKSASAIMFHETDIEDEKRFPRLASRRLSSGVLMVVDVPRLSALSVTLFGALHYHVCIPFLTPHGVLEFRMHHTLVKDTKYIKKHFRHIT